MNALIKKYGKSLLIAWLPALLLVVQLTGQISVDEKQVFAVRSGGTLYWDVDIAAVKIQAQDIQQVEIKLSEAPFGEMGESVEVYKYEAIQEGNDVRIYLRVQEPGVSTKRKWDCDYSKSLLFEISVPRDYNIDAKTAIGSIKIDGVKGKLKAHSDIGSVVLHRGSGEADLRSHAGGITVERMNGQVYVHTSAGSIKVRDARGDMKLRTSAGGILIENAEGNIDAETAVGTIEVTMQEGMSGTCRLETSAGKVIVSIHKESKFTLDAQTSLGRIRTDFPVVLTGEMLGTRIRSDVNGGGPLLKVRTSVGSIQLQKI